MKILNLFLLTLLVSCTMLKQEQGTYGAMIFDPADFNPGQAPLLIKDKNYVLWSESCGFLELDIENHYKKMLVRYKQDSSEHMVGIADVKISTYTQFLLITAVPCMRIDAKPLIIKSWAKVRNDQ
ncbi:hypothetical protein [Peredibacter starrii]|uniref:Lipoprotein n=1 Tax=Peredibacter starrii TaxID=28202 RepID=A0AAX4HTN2_9BACT|nr:hypothetical protein [Peredibacter starrii]WPU66533.1 hypothetical protein SOO65_07225 [Peredibacter starrii]